MVCTVASVLLLVVATECRLSATVDTPYFGRAVVADLLVFSTVGTAFVWCVVAAASIYARWRGLSRRWAFWLSTGCSWFATVASMWLLVQTGWAISRELPPVKLRVVAAEADAELTGATLGGLPCHVALRESDNRAYFAIYPRLSDVVLAEVVDRLAAAGWTVEWEVKREHD